MMKQYKEIKEQYQDCILFFRLGDFYEMFFEDALLASRLVEAKVLPLAAEQGFVFSLEELRRHEEALWESGGELSETDLQGIYGGTAGQFPAGSLQWLFTISTGSPLGGL